MKLKLLWRRISVSAPRMRIRTHKPWYIRLPIYALALVALFFIGKALYGAGQRITGHDNLVKTITQLEERVMSLSAERDELSAKVNASNSRFDIEKATQKQLADQVRLLTLENNRLKEDLGFYEGMLPTQAEGITIRSVRFAPEGPQQWRFRVLLMQNGKIEQESQGQLQLVLTYVVDGKSAMMILPQEAKAEAKPINSVGNLGPVSGSDPSLFQVHLKRFQKLEGVFTLPAGAALKSAQVRVLIQGQVKAQHNATL